MCSYAEYRAELKDLSPGEFVVVRDEIRERMTHNTGGGEMMVKDLMGDLESGSRVTEFLEPKEKPKKPKASGQDLVDFASAMAGANGLGSGLQEDMARYQQMSEEQDLRHQEERQRYLYEAQRQLTQTPMFQNALGSAPVPQTATAAQTGLQSRVDALADMLSTNLGRNL